MTSEIYFNIKYSSKHVVGGWKIVEIIGKMLVRVETG